MMLSVRKVAAVLALACLVVGSSAAGMRRHLLVFPSGNYAAASTVSASASSSSSFSSSSSSYSSSSTGPGGCQSHTTTSATGGAWARARGKIAGPCDVQTDSTSDSKGPETVSSEATATAAPGKSATAIASAIGSGDGVDVIATAVAKAVKDGKGEAIAIAVAEAIKDGCPKHTKAKDCPAAKATNAIVQAYASATNEADGKAYAEALAAGLVSTEKGVPSVFASAVSKILKDGTCKETKPLLSEARAIAVGDDKEREFVDALDFDVQIAECLFPTCTGELLNCCSLEEGQECSCTGKGCSYSLFKNTPNQIWRDAKEDTTCICPSSS